MNQPVFDVTRSTSICTNKIKLFLYFLIFFTVNSVSDKSLFGDDEWYFFTPRDRKYPNGVRPNRTAASGFWKATGTDKPILSASGSRRIGVKKALVFYTGRPPKGVKTDWIMTEYRLPDTTTRPSRSKGSMRVRNYVIVSLFFPIRYCCWSVSSLRSMRPT